MTIRFADALRALILSFDRVSRERARLGVERYGDLYIWTWQIDAPPAAKRQPRLMALVQDGFAEVRRTTTGMNAWRPTAAGRAAIKALDERKEPTAEEAAERLTTLEPRLRAVLADNRPHRLRKLNAELGGDVRAILAKLVAADEVWTVGPGWYLARPSTEAVKPVAPLPSFAARADEVLRALAAPRSAAELSELLGKSKQAIWGQLRTLEARGLVKGPQAVPGKRRRGRWERVAPAPDGRSRKR